jgi:hypothetical protein
MSGACNKLSAAIIIGTQKNKNKQTLWLLVSEQTIPTKFDSWHYQIFWQVVGLEQGPLSLVSTIEELLGRKGSGSGLESREYSHRDPLRWPRDTLYPQKLALTSPTSGGRSVGNILLTD